MIPEQLIKESRECSLRMKSKQVWAHPGGTIDKLSLPRQLRIELCFVAGVTPDEADSEADRINEEQFAKVARAE